MDKAKSFELLLWWRIDMKIMITSNEHKTSRDNNTHYLKVWHVGCTGKHFSPGNRGQGGGAWRARKIVKKSVFLLHYQFLSTRSLEDHCPSRVPSDNTLFHYTERHPRPLSESVPSWWQPGLWVCEQDPGGGFGLLERWDKRGPKCLFGFTCLCSLRLLY